MEEDVAKYLSDPMQLLFKTYSVGSFEVTIELDSGVGTGGLVWDGAQIMGHFFKRHPEVFGRMTRVLELGSGTGFLGIVFAKMYPNVKVHVTDIAGNLPLMERNVSLNNVSNVKVEELDWRYPYRLKDFDLIFGSDLVYLPELHAPLISTIKKLTTVSTQVYLCNEWRKKADLEFYVKARNQGLTPTILPLRYLDEMYRSEEVPVVSERLYIGNFFAASNQTMLKKEGITHIVVAAAGLPAKFPSDFTYLEVAIFDLVEYNILQHFDSTNAFISNAEEQGGKVFVHCAMGISRSASVVIAYLIRKHRWKLMKALKFLKSKHPEAQPNIGFMQQLKSYEEEVLRKDDGGATQCGSCALW